MVCPFCKGQSTRHLALRLFAYAVCFYGLLYFRPCAFLGIACVTSRGNIWQTLSGFDDRSFKYHAREARTVFCTLRRALSDPPFKEMQPWQKFWCFTTPRMGILKPWRTPWPRGLARRGPRFRLNGCPSWYLTTWRAIRATSSTNRHLWRRCKNCQTTTRLFLVQVPAMAT